MLVLGTSGGNATATAITLGTSGGNAAVLEGWIGTSGGNAQFFTSGGGVDWNNITGTTSGENNNQTMPWSTTITAGFTGVIGTPAVFYVKNNGSSVSYSAPFAVTAGDLLKWNVGGKGATSGTVNVSRTGSIPVDSFTFTLTG